MRKELNCSKPMLVVCSNCWRNVWVVEDGQQSVRFWSYRSTLNVLVIAEANVDGRIPHGLEKLSPRMLVEHPFTECAKLLPLITSVLQDLHQSQLREGKW
jgi:hypothetical protein